MFVEPAYHAKNPTAQKVVVLPRASLTDALFVLQEVALLRHLNFDK